MFTGFASENTPAIQVWECSSVGNDQISLADDCAPIQFFKTGGGGVTLYLPSAPVEGKVITIINARFGANYVAVSVRASDVSGSLANSDASIYNVTTGQTLSLFYSKNLISVPSANRGLNHTGWATLNISPAAAANVGSFAQGYGAYASGIQSIALGGSVIASGNYAGGFGGGAGELALAEAQGAMCVGVGSASGSFSGCFSSRNGISNSAGSVLIGGRYGTARSIAGVFVTPASDNPLAGVSNGLAQASRLILARQTTDATATVLTSNSSAASTTNQIILPNNSAYTFQGTCIAAKTAAGDTSGWKFEGVIKRGANAASTVLVAAVTPTVIAQDAGASTWVLAITADTTNGGIAVTVTGQAATTIRWVVKIETTEVAF